MAKKPIPAAAPAAALPEQSVEGAVEATVPAVVLPEPAAPDVAAATVEAIAAAAPAVPAAPVAPPAPVPAPPDERIWARVLDRLDHDGVTYPAGGVVGLTPDQHRALLAAGVISNEPAEALPY